jgi:hypothetical protein
LNVNGFQPPACGLQAVRLLRCDQGSKGLGFTRQPWKRRLPDVLAASDDALRVDGAFGMGYGRGGSGGTCGFAGIGARSRRNSSMRARIIAKSSAARGRVMGGPPFCFVAGLVRRVALNYTVGGARVKFQRPHREWLVRPAHFEADSHRSPAGRVRHGADRKAQSTSKSRSPDDLFKIVR